MIQSKRTDWIIRTPHEIASYPCPEGAEGFGFGAFLAKSKNLSLCGLCGEIVLAFSLGKPCSFYYGLINIVLSPGPIEPLNRMLS